MSILVNKNSRVIVQGITGSEGTFHANQMIDYGTKVVAGVTPGKGGSFATDHNIPVYNSVEEAKNDKNANTSIIFVPPRFAAEAIIESIYSDTSSVRFVTLTGHIHSKLDRAAVELFEQIKSVAIN